MQRKKLIIMTAMAVLLEAGSINTVYAKENNYTASRLGGQDRIETAVKIATNYNNGQLSAVVVTTANDFPEALVGSTLASKYKAPILSVNATARDSQSTLSYIKGHLVSDGTVYILGGTSSVSQDVENAIKNMGYSNIKRIAGANRDETFKLINAEVGVATGTPVFIASSDMFPDSLSASGIAAVKGYPILLSSKGTIPQAVVDQLQTIKPSKVYIVGGTGVMPESAVEKVKGITGLTSDNIIRLSGQDRYETSLAIAKHFNLPTKTGIIANGENFPDALAGSALSAKNKAPIILVGGEPTKQKEYIDTTLMNNLKVLGGEGVTPSSTVNKLTAKYQKIRVDGNPYETAIQISNEFARNNDIGGSNNNGEFSKELNSFTMKPIDITNQFTTNAPVSNAIIIADNDKATAVGCVPLSVYLNAPVLLTGQGQLNQQTATQLAKLKIKNVYLGGGTGMIADSVEQQLKSSGYNVIRYNGNNAIETNRLMMKAIPKDLLGPHPKVVNEEDWVQGASVAVDTKTWRVADGKTYINPIYLITADTYDPKEIISLVNPIRDVWEAKEKGVYHVYFDSNMEDSYIKSIGGTPDISTRNEKLIAYYKELKSRVGLTVAYNKSNTAANIKINNLYKNDLYTNALPYQVKAALLVNKDSASKSLAIPALSAKYGMPVVFRGNSIEAIMGRYLEDWEVKSMFTDIYKENNRLYYIGGTSEVPDGSESILNGK